jgi:hypothetical protein
VDVLESYGSCLMRSFILLTLWSYVEDVLVDFCCVDAMHIQTSSSVFFFFFVM